jgi:hypothetical protein
MFYLFEILGVFLQNTIIFGGFRASSWGILKISSSNTAYCCLVTLNRSKVLLFAHVYCDCVANEQSTKLTKARVKIMK